MKVDCLDQNKNILQNNLLVDNVFIIRVFRNHSKCLKGYSTFFGNRLILALPQS